MTLIAMIDQKTIITELLFIILLIILEPDEESNKLDMYDILEAFVITIKFVILYFNMLNVIGLIYSTLVLIGLISIVGISSINYPEWFKIMANGISKKKHQILRTAFIVALICINN